MSKPSIRQHDFADRLTLADALAHSVTAQLATAIDERGHATIAVSGGSTPKVFFAIMARAKLDWSKVTITLVDERWVPADNERSNAGMVANLLLKQNAEAATFVPLYQDAPTPDAVIDDVAARIDALKLPFDVVLLGMGPDGHTASFFPGGNNLAKAIDPDGDATVISMEAPDAGEPRITLTLPRVLDTRALYLHFEGADKHAVFEKALGGDDFPIGSVLRQHRTPVDVYYSP
jgi:6-phosphogluconolactonase